MFMLIKQCYWYLIGTKIPQIVFDFIICEIATLNFYFIFLRNP